MFKELTPVIQDRPLTITVSAVQDGKIRLCVVPQAQDKDTKLNKKITAQGADIAKIPEATIRTLTTPLVITGTPEELDGSLPGVLTKYAGTHTTLQHGIEQAEKEMLEGLNALEDRKKKARTEAKKETEAKRETKAEKGSVTPKIPTANAEPKEPDSKLEQPGSLPLAWILPNAPPTTSATDK